LKEEIPFDISILVRNVNSDDKFLIDYSFGEESQDLSEILNLTTTIGLTSLNGNNYLPLDFNAIGNELFFYQGTPQRDVLKINLKSKEFQKYSNTDGVPDEQLWENIYRLYPTPTMERIATMDSHNPSGIGNDTIFYNSLRIYNQIIGDLEVIELPDEDRISVSFSSAKTNGESYLYQNRIEKENGTLVDEWKVVDLITKEIIAQFELFNNDRNFAWHEEKIYLSNGKTFDIKANAFSEDYQFSFDLGSPDMVNAQINNDKIFFKATGVVKNDNDQETSYQEILQAYYDFDSGIIALTSNNDNPNYAVIFLDFDLNIIKVNTFVDYEPLKIMRVE